MHCGRYPICRCERASREFSTAKDVYPASGYFDITTLETTMIGHKMLCYSGGLLLQSGAYLKLTFLRLLIPSSHVFVTTERKDACV